MNHKNIAIFASGSGTNAQCIMEYFSDNQHIKVACLLSNNPGAHALTRAARFNVDTFVFNREQLYGTPAVMDYLLEQKTDLVVLAGFLWLIPGNLIRRFPMVNIHPGLLPRYGGKNMYGHRVHQAVISNKEEYSWITIHFVNEKYDDGAIIFQARCQVAPEDTPETLSEKIHLLEYEHYPRVIEQVINSI